MKRINDILGLVAETAVALLWAVDDMELMPCRVYRDIDLT